MGTALHLLRKRTFTSQAALPAAPPQYARFSRLIRPRPSAVRGAPSPSPRKARSFARPDTRWYHSLIGRSAHTASHHPHILFPSAAPSVSSSQTSSLPMATCSPSYDENLISENRRKGTWGGADEGGYERRRMQRNGDFCKGNAKPHFALAFSSGWTDEFEGMA